MAKKSRNPQFQFFIDGKPAELSEIAEASMDEKVWKSYIERNRRRLDPSADRYLKWKLGNYLSASQIHNAAGIKPSTLQNWRIRGLVKAEQLKGYWYYSVESLVTAIKSSG